MAEVLRKGRLRARVAQTRADIDATLALRAKAFRGGASDEDRFDSRGLHMLIEDHETEALLGSFRCLLLPNGSALSGCYGAQFYDLAGLSAFDAPMLELGRFCIGTGQDDPDVVRFAWGALTQVVDAHGVQMLFGCTSFAGTDPAPYAGCFARLHQRHLAPARWMPGVKAPRTLRLAQITAGRAAPEAMPPLLRSYLMMGGWVSDHAVVDNDLNTLHVFTGLEVATIPPARQRLLRALAGDSGAQGRP